MRLVALNEQSARTLGLSAESVVGRLFSELATKAAYDERFVWLRQVTETGEPFERELRVQRPDGQWLWVNVSARRFDDYVVITYSDVTERRQLDQKRQEEQELLESVFGNLYIGITQYQAVRKGDPVTGPIINFRIKRVNDVAVRRTGYGRDAIIGRLATEVNPVHKASGMFERCVAVCTTGKPFQIETYYSQLDGWFELSVTKLGDGVIITSNDITERKRSEQLSSTLR